MKKSVLVTVLFLAGLSVLAQDIYVKKIMISGEVKSIEYVKLCDESILVNTIMLQNEGDTVSIVIDTTDGGLDLANRVHVHAKNDTAGDVCYHEGLMPIVNTNEGNRFWADTNSRPNWLLANPDTSIKVNYTFIMEDTLGRVGIGTTNPTSKLQVIGLPTYADNAAAITGGLTAGAFYRTGGDPDPICVVH